MGHPATFPRELGCDMTEFSPEVSRWARSGGLESHSLTRLGPLGPPQARQGTGRPGMLVRERLNRPVRKKGLAKARKAGPVQAMGAAGQRAEGMAHG